MSDFNIINPSMTPRKFPYAGDLKSSQLNAAFEECLQDTSAIVDVINNTIIPILNGLGAPGTYTDVNPVEDGLDGTTMMANRASSSTPYFYDASKNRPKTIYEALVSVTTDINSLFNSLNTVNRQLSSTQESTTTSSATLSQIESRVNFLNTSVTSLTQNIQGFLSASGIAAGIANQTINPSSFHILDADVETNAAVAPTKISGVDLTQAFVYTTGQPADYDIKDTILRLKEFVEDCLGDSIVSFAASGLSGDALKTHREKVGTGTVSATNPHGQDISNLNDSQGVLSRPIKIASFDVRPSGLTSYVGGYEYSNASYVVTQIAGTVEIGTPGTITLTVKRYRPSAGTSVDIYNGLVIPNTNPGRISVTTGFTNTQILAEDMLWISGATTGGLNARVSVWGTPA